MREIKFRAWHEGHKKMFSPEEMGCDQLTLMPDGAGFINVSGSHTRMYQLMTNMIPMQYTGFKDKNGKEIYEGDFITTTESYSGSHPVAVKWGTMGCWVLYNPKCCSTCKNGCGCISDIGEAFDYRLPHGGFEVIGNIHENPELL